MAFNINDIRAQLTFGGARPSLFQVIISNPINPVADFKLPFLCKTAQLPSSELGLIEVETASHDRRVKQLSLSKAGAKLETQLTQSQTQHLARAFRRCGDKALDGWIKIMQSLPTA